MRTDLDHLPHRKQRELERAVGILHGEFANATTLATADWKKRGRILKIILFGSHVRDTWVEDSRKGGGYFSDFDLLVVVNDKRLTDMAEFWSGAEDRLFLERLSDSEMNFIVHSLHEVNDALARGKYFFCDIVKDGIALYELKGTKPFAKPQPLTDKEALETAEKHYEQWFESAGEFYDDFARNAELGRNKKAAFELHQAVERLYACLLLVLTNYSPNSHNIKFLRSLTEQLDPSLIDAWPRQTRADRRCFELLKRAYVEARYSEHYEITEEQLAWLGTRTEVLQQHVETICKDRIATLAAPA